MSCRPEAVPLEEPKTIKSSKAKAAEEEDKGSVKKKDKGAPPPKKKPKAGAAGRDPSTIYHLPLQVRV